MEYGHGGDVYRNRNVELDFSINVNPLGMPNFVWEADEEHRTQHQISGQYLRSTPRENVGTYRDPGGDDDLRERRCGADLPAGADVMPEESRDPRPVFYGI